MTEAAFVKRYRHAAAAAAAVNHRWLAQLGGPLRLPRLLAVVDHTVHLERIQGRHAQLGDLQALAGHLGRVHGWAYREELHVARLDRPHVAADHRVADFISARLPALQRNLRQGVPGALLTADQAERLLRQAAVEPAAFYKDLNPRNILVTSAVPVDVDVDHLTLAPFGYDLAKLIVTSAMTHGRLPPGTIPQALGAYNAGADLQWPGLGHVTVPALLVWAEVHHALTWRYLGRHGYWHSWHHLRPDVPRAVQP